MNPNYTARWPSICTPTPAHLLSALPRDAPTLSKKVRNVTVPHFTFSRAIFVSFKLGYLLADNERFLLFQWIFLATGNLESRFKTKHKMLRMFKAVFLIIVYYVPVYSVMIRTIPVLCIYFPGPRWLLFHCNALSRNITSHNHSEQKCGENFKCHTNADLDVWKYSSNSNWKLDSGEKLAGVSAAMLHWHNPIFP